MSAKAKTTLFTKDTNNNLSNKQCEEFIKDYKEYKNGKISNAYILKNGKKHCVSCRILYTDRQCCKCKEE